MVSRAAILSVALASSLGLNVPAAVAGYGAVAYDTGTRKAGSAWNEDTQQKADDAALRMCGSDQCKVLFAVAPGMCAAFATPESGPAWSGATKTSIIDAEISAMKDCQARIKVRCLLRQSRCNN